MISTMHPHITQTLLGPCQQVQLLLEHLSHLLHLAQANQGLPGDSDLSSDGHSSGLGIPPHEQGQQQYLVFRAILGHLHKASQAYTAASANNTASHASLQLALQICQVKYTALESIVPGDHLDHGIRIIAENQTFPDFAAGHYRRLRPFITGLYLWHQQNTAPILEPLTNDDLSPSALILTLQSHMQDACQLVSVLPLLIRHELYLPLINALQLLPLLYSLPAITIPPATPYLLILRRTELDTRQHRLSKKLIRFLRHSMQPGYQWQLAAFICAELAITNEQCLHACQQSINLAWNHAKPIGMSLIKALNPFETKNTKPNCMDLMSR